MASVTISPDFPNSAHPGPLCYGSIRLPLFMPQPHDSLVAPARAIPCTAGKMLPPLQCPAQPSSFQRRLLDSLTPRRLRCSLTFALKLFGPCLCTKILHLLFSFSLSLSCAFLQTRTTSYFSFLPSTSHETGALEAVGSRLLGRGRRLRDREHRPPMPAAHARETTGTPERLGSALTTVWGTA